MFDEKKFRAQMVLAGVNFKRLADELHIAESTLYRKMKDGGNFTRAEMNTMIGFLNISDPESIFFAPELAETQG